MGFINLRSHRDGAWRTDSDRVGRPADGQAGLAQIVNLALEMLNGNQNRQPAVGQLGGHFHTLGIHRCQINRNMGANGLKAQRKAALQIEQLARVFERLTLHNRVDDLHILAHALEWRIECDPMKMFDHLWATRPQAEQHPPLRDLIQGGKVLGQCCGGA